MTNVLLSQDPVGVLREGEYNPFRDFSVRVRSGHFAERQKELLTGLGRLASELSQLEDSIEALGTDLPPEMFIQELSNLVNKCQSSNSNNHKLTEALQSLEEHVTSNYTEIYRCKQDTMANGVDAVRLYGREAFLIQDPSKTSEENSYHVIFSPFCVTYVFDDSRYSEVENRLGYNGTTNGVSLGSTNAIRGVPLDPSRDPMTTYSHERMHSIIKPIIPYGLSRENDNVSLSKSVIDVKEQYLKGDRTSVRHMISDLPDRALLDVKNELIAFGAEMVAGRGRSFYAVLSEISKHVEKVIEHFKGAQKFEDFRNTSSVDVLFESLIKVGTSTDVIAFTKSLEELAFIAALEAKQHRNSAFGFFRKKEQPLKELLDECVYSTAKKYVTAVEKLTEALTVALELSPDCAKKVLAAAIILHPKQYHHLPRLATFFKEEGTSS